MNARPESLSLFAVLAITSIAFLTALLITTLARRYAQANKVLDLPNERSSHDRPVPRGGGISIVLVTVAYSAIAGAAGWLDTQLVWAVLGGALIAGIGWWDDHRPLSSGLRLLVQLAACSWAVYCLGGKSLWHIGDQVFDLGLLGSCLAVLLLMWLTNLFNFMDGIDGLAGSEGVFVLAGGAAVAFAAGGATIGLLALVAASACLGFLCLNWPPAKIFMGDVGSAFLGFFIGIVALAAESQGLPSVIFWLTLAGIFVADATLTLLRRMVNGERWYAAHRSHAYQRLTQCGWSHLRVTTFALSINLLVLLPLAIAIWTDPSSAVWFAGLAASLLIVTWLAVHTLTQRARAVVP